MTDVEVMRSQSTFSIIIKMLDRVEVRDMLRPVKLFHTTLGKQFIFRPSFKYRVILSC